MKSAGTAPEQRWRCSLRISRDGQSPCARCFAAAPDVFNHNLETVPRLYAAVRPQADYARSLDVLAAGAQAGLIVKSGLMLGLGEEMAELERVFHDLRSAGCSFLTLGQYLPPSPQHARLVRYVSPEEFADLKQLALEMGFGPGGLRSPGAQFLPCRGNV